MSDKPVKILLVEDNPGDADLVKEMLAEARTVRFELTHRDRLSTAIEFLSRERVDIILLDLSLPDGHGLDTVIETNIARPDIPIVVMSGLGDEELAVQALHEGAQDYLVKGQVDGNLLTRAVRYAIERKQAEEALRRAYDGLEMRVQERTAELVRANRALQESERKYRMLIEQASDGISILDRPGNIVEINSMACQMLGFEREELLNLNIRDLIPAEDLAALPLRIDEVLAGETIIFERRLRHKQGRFVSVEISAKMLEDGRVQTIVRDLTERKRAEEALRRSEASLAEAQRIAYLGNWDWDIRTNELHWSDEIYRIFGSTPQQFGATYGAFLDRVHPDDRELVEKSVKEALYGVPFKIEHRILLPDGTVRFVHEQGEVTFGESGEPVHMLGIVQDISDRKKVEEALRESEERYRRLVNAVTAYTYSVEISNGQVVSTHHSMGCLSITGYSPEDYGGDPYLWHSMIYSGDRLMVDNSIRDMLKGREVSPFEHRLVRRDGKVVWVRNTMVPHRDERGQVIRYDGLIEDITERKEAEKALQDSKAKYAAIVEGFDGFIYICTENNDILFMNERLIEHIGYDATGRKCYKAIHGLESICPWCEHQRMEGNKTTRGELHNPKDNRWYYTVSTPVHNQDGGISSIIMVQDITDKKENELRLIMSERLAALGLMASGIAHEINNPLASIAACAEGLLNRIRKGQLSQELFENYLKIINEEVIRCKSITTSMLSFVRKTPYEKKDVDIHSVIENVLDLIGFQGRLKEVEVVKNFEGALIVQASEGELKQVFLSVIVNALDAMDDTGFLTIGTGVVPPDHSSENEGGVFIKITDTGPGIPVEHVDKIFDPFYTTRTGKGGTGLGLSIAHKIIKDHSGSISVTSEKGKGTSFTITLPK